MFGELRIVAGQHLRGPDRTGEFDQFAEFDPVIALAAGIRSAPAGILLRRRTQHLTFKFREEFQIVMFDAELRADRFHRSLVVFRRAQLRRRKFRVGMFQPERHSDHFTPRLLRQHRRHRGIHPPGKRHYHLLFHPKILTETVDIFIICPLPCHISIVDKFVFCIILP